MAETTVIRKQDVDALAGKLEAFARELPEQERNVLGWLMARAQSASDSELSETQLDSVAGGLADSVGFGGLDSGSEVSTTWKYTFAE